MTFDNDIWHWMMQFCKDHHMNPANKEALEIAEQAYRNYIKEYNEKNKHSN